MTATTKTAGERHPSLGELAPNITFRPPADETPRQRADRAGLLRPQSVEKDFTLNPDGWASRKTT